MNALVARGPGASALAGIALAALVLAPLSVARPAAAQRPSSESMQALKVDPQALLGVISGYLEMVGKMRAGVGDPLTTQIIVQHDLKEIYERLGRPEEAVKIYRQQLDSLKDPDARIAMRFAIVDVLKTTGKTEEALEELKAILRENQGRLEARR